MPQACHYASRLFVAWTVIERLLHIEVECVIELVRRY